MERQPFNQYLQALKFTKIKIVIIPRLLKQIQPQLHLQHLHPQLHLQHLHLQLHLHLHLQQEREQGRDRVREQGLEVLEALVIKPQEDQAVQIIMFL